MDSVTDATSETSICCCEHRFCRDTTAVLSQRRRRHGAARDTRRAVVHCLTAYRNLSLLVLTVAAALSVDCATVFTVNWRMVCHGAVPERAHVKADAPDCAHQRGTIPLPPCGSAVHPVKNRRCRSRDDRFRPGPGTVLRKEKKKKTKGTNRSVLKA